MNRVSILTLVLLLLCRCVVQAQTLGENVGPDMWAIFPSTAGPGLQPAMVKIGRPFLPAEALTLGSLWELLNHYGVEVHLSNDVGARLGYSSLGLEAKRENPSKIQGLDIPPILREIDRYRRSLETHLQVKLHVAPLTLGTSLGVLKYSEGAKVCMAVSDEGAVERALASSLALVDIPEPSSVMKIDEVWRAIFQRTSEPGVQVLGYVTDLNAVLVIANKQQISDLVNYISR